MKPSLRISALSAAAAVAVLGIVAPPAPADTLRIKAAGSPGNFVWQPDIRHASPGDRIVWKNPTTATHTVTAYGGGWSKNVKLAPGERTRKRFEKKGIYEFRCTKHSQLQDGECSGMCGYVHVM